MRSAAPTTRSFVDGRRQLVLIGGLTLIYFIIRAVTANQEDEAMTNAASIVAFEQRFGLDLENSIHDAAMASEPFIRFCNTVYLWGHFPVLIATLVILWAFRNRDYARMRNALIVSGAIGLAVFAIYPVAPPRLYAPDIFFDTVHELSASHRILQNPRFTNQYAAIPSFHVGWNMLAALAICRGTTRRPLRVLAALMPLTMCVAVVVTANHWLIDIVIGAAVALIGWMCAGWFSSADDELTIDLRDDQSTSTATPGKSGAYL